jgi:hypothetical protein
LLLAVQANGPATALAGTAGRGVNAREKRIAEIDKRARRYRDQLATDWVRAVDDVRGYRPSGGPFSIKKGTLVSRGSFAVERYPSQFAALDERSIEARVKSWVHRERVAWRIG